MPGLEDSGHRQLFWQNDVAELVDGSFLFVPFGVLEFLNTVEDLTEISGRIDGQLFADTDLQFARDVDPENDRFAVEIQFALLNELSQRNDAFLLFWINAANHRRESTLLEFDDYRALHIRRARNHARHAVDLLFQRAPVVQDVFARDQNVGVEIDDLLPQFS